MEDKIVSFVMPAYNVSKFIEKSVLSVVSLPEFNSTSELIIVNDGSTDSTLDVIEELLVAEKLQNVKVISQCNAGLSAARNTGIAAASGKYLAFVDSDDILSASYLKKILFIIKSAPDIDVIKFDFYFFKDEKEIKIAEDDFVASNDLLVLTGDQILKSEVEDCSWYAWRRIYRREIFDEIAFPISKKYEDILTIPYCMSVAKKLIIIKDKLIYYRSNYEGITKNTNSVAALDSISDFALLDKKFSKTNVSPSVIRLHKENVFKVFVNLVAASKDINDKLSFIFKQKNENFLKKSIAGDIGIILLYIRCSVLQRLSTFKRQFK